MSVKAIGVFFPARVDTTCTFCNFTLFSESICSACPVAAVSKAAKITVFLISLSLLMM